jgi:pimeloyl-ACP methyl ester carboxylesterase
VKRAGFLAGVAAATVARPATAADLPYDLITPTGAIYGSLLLPAAPARPPVVLIVAGSGPTNRDGNNPLGVGAAPYRLLAEALASAGIASVRYDKRGIARSAEAGPLESALRFEDYVGDAAAWLGKLRADGRFAKSVLAGHSEGSLIGMIAAQRSPTDAFVSLAGGGFPAGQVLRRQLEPQTLAPEVKTQIDGIIGALEAGKPVSEVPLPLMALFHASVQPYLISWFRYDPRVEIAKLKIPCTIVQGTNDVQVSVDDARALAAAQPRAKLVLIDGMTHVLKDAPPATPALEQIKTVYADPLIPVDATLLRTVTDAVR